MARSRQLHQSQVRPRLPRSAGYLIGLLLFGMVGCASTLSVVEHYEDGKLKCKSRVSSRIMGTGETELASTNPCGGDTAYSTRDTGISDNAKSLGVQGIKAGVTAARPGGLLEEGASSALLGH